MMPLDQISMLLGLADLPKLPNYDALRADLAAHKALAVEASDEALAKQIWCLEHTVSVQTQFQKAYAQLREGAFFDGWCTLEQVELALGRLLPHFEEYWRDYWLHFVDEKTLMLQGLFPYQIFTSPEILELEKECSICGQKVSIRNPCGHRVGEVYSGEYCFRNVTKCKILGVAMVKDPVQKYSVPFLVDPQTGESKDHYNYSTIQYLMRRWPTPFHDWSVKWTTALHPKSLFGQLGRNDKCPCDSGRKYKRCCLRREGIRRPHCEFTFNYAIPADLQTTELSYKGITL